MARDRTASLDNAVDANAEADAEADAAKQKKPAAKGKRGSFGFDGGSKVPIPKKSEFSEMKEGDVRAHPKYFEHKNYAIQFETAGWTDARGIVHEQNITQLYIANSTDWKSELKDPESGEEIEFFFAIITAKSTEGDLKLSHMCDAMRAAHVHFHTYDAKSGLAVRITRCGATLQRLKDYADATLFKQGLNAVEVASAAEKVGLAIKNPDGNPGGWYEPFEHMWAPYQAEKASLYRPFGPADRLLVFKRIFMADTMYAGPAKGCGFDIDELESDREDNAFCLAVFPMHEDGAKTELAKKWLTWDWPWKLPLVDIKQYFGDEIAFYFAFLGHLTSGLLFLAGFAVVAQGFSLGTWETDGGAMYAESFFALLGLGAFFVMLDSWKYFEGKKAVLWEVHGCRESVPPRPGFKGLVLENPRTGKIEIDFPNRMRRPRVQVGQFINFALSTCMLLTVSAIFVFKRSVRPDDSQFMQLLPTILNSLQIMFYDALYKYIATRVTEYENHRTIAEHNSQLFKKLTTFYFLNSYSALFYIAFVKSECYDPLSGSTFCGRELGVQVLIVFVVNDFLSRMVASVVIPTLSRLWKQRAASRDETIKSDNIGVIEKQFSFLGRYDASSNLIFDYIELYIQWGYLVFFGASAPIVVVFALITNFIETRADGNKLLFSFRRVVPQRVDGVGEPLITFTLMCYIAIPVNAGLMVYCFGSFDSWLPDDYRVWVFVGICAIFYGALKVLDVLFPDLPEASEIQLARMAVVYDRVIKELPDDGYLKVELDKADIGKYADNVTADLNASRPAPLLSVCELDSNFDLVGLMGSGSSETKAKSKGSKM